MTLEDIKKLNIPDEFGCNENDDSVVTSSIDEVEEQLHQYKDAPYTTWGVSKFVILLNDDIVVKIPFTGRHYDIEDNDYDEWEEPEEGFEYFYSGIDYCLLEEEKYQEAVNAGLGFMFTKTEIGGKTANGKQFYVSERVIPYRSSDNHARNDSKEIVKTISSKYKKGWEFNSNWLGLVYEYYGEETVKALLQFVEDADMNDFHGGNLGFRACNGAPVILDYSGFDED